MKAFKLDNEPKINIGFTTPVNYFENFLEKVMQKIAEPEVKVILLSSKRKSRIYTAAAVLVLALSIPLLNKFVTPSNEPDAAALETYLAYHADISDEQLVDLLETEDIEKIKVDYKIEDKALEDMLSSNADIENYIIN
jgi:hypothetical protein